MAKNLAEKNYKYEVWGWYQSSSSTRIQCQCFLYTVLTDFYDWKVLQKNHFYLTDVMMISWLFVQIKKLEVEFDRSNTIPAFSTNQQLHSVSRLTIIITIPIIKITTEIDIKEIKTCWKKRRKKDPSIVTRNPTNKWLTD